MRMCFLPLFSGYPFNIRSGVECVDKHLHNNDQSQGEMRYLKEKMFNSGTVQI